LHYVFTYNVFLSIYTVFIDYDFFTGFGTPFELLLEGTYLIRSKGGIVGGFSGFMSFIPELELSMYIFINVRMAIIPL